MSRASLIFHVSNNRTGIGRRTIDVDLGKHRKGDGILPLAELRNLRRITRLLRAELVAGKPSTRKATRRVPRPSSSRPLYCGVNPQALAVLTIGSTCPSNRLRGTSSPASELAVKS